MGHPDPIGNLVGMPYPAAIARFIEVAPQPRSTCNGIDPKDGSREPGLMRTLRSLGTLFLAFCGVWLGSLGLAASGPDYAVVVSRQTYDAPGWRQVVETLQHKHAGTLIIYEASVEEALPQLRGQFPRYVCFVAQPKEATRQFVVQVHRLTRRLDADPYTDCFWGILTGYNAANALRIAKCSAQLTVRKVAGGTRFPLADCESGVWYSELKPGLLVKKQPGGQPEELQGPTDSTEELVKTLTDFHADLFIASGHASEHNWLIGYAYRNGQFRCENGVLYGLDTQHHKWPIHSSNPKLYMPVGNCLMGHIDGTNAMALAWMNSAGVNQMIGYVVTTWYGYAGWGCLDYFVDQPGRYTFAEAFLANQLALEHRLKTYFPALLEADINQNGRTSIPIQVTPAARRAGLTAQDGRGLLYDRDFLAFYGDPAWEARMAEQDLAWKQTLTEKDGVWTFTIKPNRGERTFQTVDTNGSQRGGRPIIQFLPKRLKDIQLLEGGDLRPVITDTFVLVPNTLKRDSQRTYRVVFRAAPIE